MHIWSAFLRANRHNECVLKAHKSLLNKSNETNGIGASYKQWKGKSRMVIKGILNLEEWNKRSQSLHIFTYNKMCRLAEWHPLEWAGWGECSKMCCTSRRSIRGGEQIHNMHTKGSDRKTWNLPVIVIATYIETSIVHFIGWTIETLFMYNKYHVQLHVTLFFNNMIHLRV